ncbi:MAG: SusC/RagA family TonB-linked outer membrane protein, partial [Bacteroidales bacterium]
TIAGATLTDRRAGVFKSVKSYDGLNSGLVQNLAELGHANNYNYKWENILTYNFKIAENHDFTVTGVSSWEHRQSESSLMKGEGMSSDKYLFHNMGAANIQKNESDYSMWKNLGFIGRVNYSYLGKYLASVSCRWDGASVLAEGNKWSTYPAVALGWRINEESFMENTSEWLSNLKLRLGYGKSGSANINPFTSVSYLESGYINIGGIKVPTNSFSPNLSNRLLTWENSYNTNVGIDASFLNSRINLTLDWYNTETKGVIFNRQMPSTMGGASANAYYTMMQNIARTNNKGIEIALNTMNIVKKDFTWSSTITFARNNEKIKSLLNGVNEIISGPEIKRVGEPANSFYHYKIEGIWQKGEEAEAAIFGKEPGDIKIATKVRKDADGYFYTDKDGKRVPVSKYTYGADDYQVIGHKTPDWTGGFQNNFTYKDFDLSFFLYARWGQMIKYGTILAYDPTGKKNGPAHFNYWTPDNASNDFPAANANKELSSYTGYDALQYVDGSFIKIKNITLGYNLPKSLVEKAKISKLRIYTTIENPFVFAKNHLLEDYDPEMNGDNDFPLTKQFVVGVNLTF